MISLISLWGNVGILWALEVPSFFCLYLCDDPTPDGFKVRAGGGVLGIQLDSKSFLQPTSSAQFRFPIIPTYKEHRFNDFLYEQVITDVEVNFTSNLVAKGANLDLDKYLTENEQNLVSLFPNWGIQASTVSTFFIVAETFNFYMFWDADFRKTRVRQIDATRMKFGIGPALGIYLNEIELLFCGEVDIARGSCEDSIQLTETQTNVRNLSSKRRVFGIGLGYSLTYTLYEYIQYDADIAYSILAIEYFQIFGQNVEFRNRSRSSTYNFSHLSIDLFNYTWFF